MSRLQERLARISPLSIGVIVIFATIMTVVLFKSFAATGPATLYTTPSGTQAVTTGQSFTVNVRISTAGNVPVTGASVYLSYPADKLQVTGESYGGPYSTQLFVGDSGGVLRMDRAAFPMISGGDQLFAQVTFKAISAGSAAIGFTGSSVVTSGDNDSNLTGARNGVTYNISAPATPPPSSGGGSSSGGSGSSSGSSGSGSGSSSSSGGSSGSSGSGSTGGSNTGSGSSGGSSGGGSSSSSGSGSSQSGGNSTSSGTIITSSVKITVVDSKGKPVEGAEVIIDDQTVKTDKTGTAYFNGVVTGKLKIAVKYNGKKTSKTLQVKGASTQSPELFKVSITRNKFNPTLLLLPVVILVAAAAFIFRPWSGKLTLHHADTPGMSDTPVVVSSSQPPTVDQTPITPGRKIETPGTTITPTSTKDNDTTKQ